MCSTLSKVRSDDRDILTYMSAPITASDPVHDAHGPGQSNMQQATHNQNSPYRVPLSHITLAHADDPKSSPIAAYRPEEDHLEGSSPMSPSSPGTSVFYSPDLYTEPKPTVSILLMRPNDMEVPQEASEARLLEGLVTIGSPNASSPKKKGELKPKALFLSIHHQRAVLCFTCLIFRACLGLGRCPLIHPVTKPMHALCSLSDARNH